MKKLLSLVCVAMAIVFTACEDVPAPYTINSNGNPDSKTLLNESFASSLGKFANFTTDGGVAWKNSYSCATATGYDNATKTTTDGTAYLVGPAVDLTNVDSAYVTYEYILRFNRSQDYQKLLIAEDFVPNANTVASQAWETLIANHTEGSDYTTFYTATAQIPQKYMGKKVRIALYFKCETNSSTWEVKNLKVMKGEAGSTPEPTPGPTGEPKGTGTLEDPFNSVAVINYIHTLGNDVESPQEVYIMGKVVSITDQYGTQYGNATFFISDDGTSSNQFQVYRALYFGNKKYTSGTKLKVGDDVIICGKVVNFRGSTPETVTGKAYLYSLNGKTESTDEPGPDPVPEPSGDNLIANGTFESWSGGEPVYWKSASTASSATLSQSNESHSGSYSVEVEGTSASNKRLAYKEITLKAGSYNMKFYAKAATSAGGSVRPGFVPVEGGKVGTYVYGDYVNNLTTGEWTEVNHPFTLSGETTICLLVMNPKNPGANVLIDDVELTTSDGGLADGSGDDPDDNPDDNPGDDTGIPYSITFTSSTEGWTINDIDLGGLNYVWKQDKTYGMKASAFYSSKNNAAESDFISPEFTIPAAGATLSINHALNFLSGNKRADFVAVQVINGNTTEELELSAWPAGTDYTYVDATASLAKYAGKTIKIVFHYKSTTDCAPTWEIKTLSIQ